MLYFSFVLPFKKEKFCSCIKKDVKSCSVKGEKTEPNPCWRKCGCQDTSASGRKWTTKTLACRLLEMCDPDVRSEIRSSVAIFPVYSICFLMFLFFYSKPRNLPWNTIWTEDFPKMRYLGNCSFMSVSGRVQKHLLKGL